MPSCPGTPLEQAVAFAEDPRAWASKFVVQQEDGSCRHFSVQVRLRDSARPYQVSGLVSTCCCNAKDQACCSLPSMLGLAGCAHGSHVCVLCRTRQATQQAFRQRTWCHTSSSSSRSGSTTTRCECACITASSLCREYSGQQQPLLLLIVLLALQM